MTTAATRALEPVREDSERASFEVLPTRGVVRSLLQLLGSNALISLTGLACLPLLYRNLGAAAYGHFSLFLLALGLASSLDVSRPTLVRELSRQKTPREPSRRGTAPARDDLPALIGVSQCLLVPAAVLVGALLFGPASGVALGIATLLFIASSGPYAQLAAQDRVGLAAAVRNIAWVGAFVASTGLSFLELPRAAFVWPFVLANLVILLVNRHLAGAGSGPFLRRPRLDVLRAFRGQSLDILGLSLATAVVVSADKLILQSNASGELFGRYSAQYDLAIKINVLSTALGTVLFPAFSRLFAERGLEQAARVFVRQVSWIVLAYFAGLMTLLFFSEEVLALVLGPDAERGAVIYPLLLVGIFLALFGHLITPWQRACGDFRTHRRVYALVAVVMVVLGFVLIPRYGMLGAALTYLSARLADVLLVACEVRRIPRSILGPGRVLTLALLLLILVVYGGWRFAALGGLA